MLRNARFPHRSERRNCVGHDRCAPNWLQAMNTRSILADRSLEITTSAALIVNYLLGVLVGLGHIFTRLQEQS